MRQLLSKHLDIACGSNPRNPFNCEELYGIDIIQNVCSYGKIVPSDIHAQHGRNIVEGGKGFYYTQGNAVLEPLPYNDNFFDTISAYDFLEHIPRLITERNNVQFPFIEFMNEVFRVLKCLIFMGLTEFLKLLEWKMLSLELKDVKRLR